MDRHPSMQLDESTLEMISSLERTSRQQRHGLMAARRDVARFVASGGELAQPSQTTHLRQDPEWKVTPPPADLTHRLTELATLPNAVQAKAAMSSGADVWVADLEDMLVPSVTQWNVAQETIAQVAATRSGDDSPGVPTLMVRPRGMHLEEKHLIVDDAPVSAPIADVAAFLSRCARTLIDNGTGPYLYLPKVETGAEAEWWNAWLSHAEELLGLPHDTIRVSVLVETVSSIYELEEIVYALRKRVTGLAAGRWDYVFSYLRTYATRPDHVLPDREAFTMNTRFLRTYTTHIVQVARRRGVQAIGGPVALTPGGPFDESVSMTHARMHRDKAREAKQGFDGAWVLHPALVPVARAPFEERDALRAAAASGTATGRQMWVEPELPEGEILVDVHSLRDVSTLPGSATLSGMRAALRSSLSYLTGWLAGMGTSARSGHLEDFGTVELARMQLWQWMYHRVRFAEGPSMSPLLWERMLEDEINLLRRRGAREDLLVHAVNLLRDSVLATEPPAFLAQQAYDVLLSLGEPVDGDGDHDPDPQDDRSADAA